MVVSVKLQASKCEVLTPGTREWEATSSSSSRWDLILFPIVHSRHHEPSWTMRWVVRSSCAEYEQPVSQSEPHIFGLADEYEQPHIFGLDDLVQLVKHRAKGTAKGDDTILVTACMVPNSTEESERHRRASSGETFFMPPYCMCRRTRQRATAGESYLQLTTRAVPREANQLEEKKHQKSHLGSNNVSWAVGSRVTRLD